MPVPVLTRHRRCYAPLNPLHAQAQLKSLQAKHQQDLSRRRDRVLALESEARSLRRALDGNQDQTSAMVRELTTARDTAQAQLDETVRALADHGKSKAEAQEAAAAARAALEVVQRRVGAVLQRQRRRVSVSAALVAWREAARARRVGRRVLTRLLRRPTAHPLCHAWEAWRRHTILSTGAIQEEINRMLDVSVGCAGVRGAA